MTKLLHLIGDFERVSDHAVNIVESIEEKKDKNIRFSDEAFRELSVMKNALTEILEMTRSAMDKNDLTIAFSVEPLEQVIDYLRDELKLRHTIRLQQNRCSIELGFILTDILTNFERVSDHCSNIASCLIEMSRSEAMDLHHYLSEIKDGTSKDFNLIYDGFMSKYSLPEASKE